MFETHKALLMKSLGSSVLAVGFIQTPYIRLATCCTRLMGLMQARRVCLCGEGRCRD